MLERLVEVAVRHRLAVALVFTVLAVLGARALAGLRVDAFPDTTPVQVQINTVVQALGPEEVERQVSFPVETAIAGLPGLRNVRSVSKFGFSQVVATFAEGTSILDARQLVMERLGTVELPAGIAPPSLGPIATGLGEIFHYVLRSEDPARTLTELRTLHDWVVKPELRKVPGVAEVNSWGGYEKQYQVTVSPEALVAYGLTLDEVVEALERNNRNVGGGRLTVSGEDLLVHGVGRLETVDQIGGVTVRSHDGVPVRVRDVAEVSVDHEIRRGAVTAGGRGEAVLGLGFMLMGENPKEVTERLKARVAEVRSALPEDVVLETVYDRTELVDHVIGTVRHNLFLGALLVVVTLLVLFGGVRVGLVIAVTIPLALILAALGMRELGIAASLLSLGAMDFGIIVDGAVVMAENNLRRLAQRRKALGRDLEPEEREETVAAASREVVRPVVFGVLIIALVLVPVLALQGVEGKLFRPMALTLILALAGALATAVFLTPALSLWFLPRRPQVRESAFTRLLLRLYEPALRRALRFRRAVLAGTGALLVLAGVLAARTGSEFVPRLSEGAVTLSVVRLAGISLDESTAYNTRIERMLLEAFPDEIAHVWSRTGTAEVATDPMGTELTDIFLALKPRKEWTRARTQEDLVARIDAVVGDLPGQTVAYSQPIEMRVNEMASGIRTDLAVKVFGDDFDELVRLGEEIQAVLASIPGAADVAGEQLTGQPVLRVAVDRDAIARNGVPAAHVLEMVEAVGGVHVGEIQEGQRRFPLVVRLPEALRTDPAAFAATVVPAAGGLLLPLSAVAGVETAEAPATITREWGRRRTVVQCNIRGRDVGSFVNEARRRIAAGVAFPAGYTVEYGGQFEALQSANARFRILVPLTLGLVFLLLLLSLRRLGDALVVYTGIPLAAVGGVAALWLRGLPFSVSAAVGFIALSGIAVLNGQVLVSTLRRLLAEGMGMAEAVVTAGRLRLRPVLATAITDAVGFLPMALSTGPGAEVQRPLATVVIGGVLTSTVLTLLVLPVLYRVFETRLAGGGGR